ncbi:penicillin-binding protein 2 [Sporosarcina sp. PTS2304]|uniref:peptidoglycan D,D-transpeptidase FtsI family protein n=1 Tax=Sporosarcina sp. PTS2304 TaxID=2283194 RepID=UPI000E0DF934|nr:penicillin-binding protein 2 [Sporosarcina sp. PTS2304]AXH99005.1 penicillin-binding protein 2 [Sporosarcina sp. PTS2304]
MKKNQKKTDQSKATQRQHIPFRMNFLFVAIFALFSLLIFRLGYLQIVKGDDYTSALERTEEIAVNTSTPRGRIFDRNGQVLIDNEAKNAITYTKTSSTTSAEMLKLARKISKWMAADTKRVTIGDKRDFWILLNPEEAAKKVPKEEQISLSEDDKLSKKDVQRQINQLTRDRITDEELSSLTSEDIKVLAIYREMMAGYAYSPQIIKSDGVTDREFAIISERLDELPGFNTTTDWERVKKSDSAILGSTTSPVEGIPRSHVNYFLARDYSRNDRVGRSYLESYYEDLLKGQKTIVKNIKDRTGKVIETKTVKEGVPGKDLVLTTDSDLQHALEDVVSNKLLRLKQTPNTSALESAFLVMLDPNNGEILSLVGKKVVKDESTGKWAIQDYTFGTFTSAYEVGSTVKLATMLTGYHEGAARIGEVKIDQPINVGGRYKRSLFNPNGRVALNDISAIGRSSNVYMFRIAMGLGNAVYRPGQGLPIDKKAFDTFRENFASFGLGVKTGIDLPGEYTGVTGTETIPGKLLDFSIGQFDTYTPLQMAQYVATIASDGKRIAPRILKEIREPSPDGDVLGPLVEERPVQLLNYIKNSQPEIDQVKKGMHYVYYGNNGTASGLLAGASYDGAGKTGTAESFYYTGNKSNPVIPTINLSHVGYAPSKNPEVAYSVIVPYISTNTKRYPSATASEIAREALDVFFDLKRQRNAESIKTSSPEIKIKKVDE